MNNNNYQMYFNVFIIRLSSNRIVYYYYSTTKYNSNSSTHQAPGYIAYPSVLQHIQATAWIHSFEGFMYLDTLGATKHCGEHLYFQECRLQKNIIEDIGIAILAKVIQCVVLISVSYISMWRPIL